MVLSSNSSTGVYVAVHRFRASALRRYAALTGNVHHLTHQPALLPSVRVRIVLEIRRELPQVIRAEERAGFGRSELGVATFVVDGFRVLEPVQYKKTMPTSMIAHILRQPEAVAVLLGVLEMLGEC
jgi:hypothetical protein